MASFALPHPFLIYCRVLPPRVCGSPVQLLKGFLRLVRNVFRSPKRFPNVLGNAFRRLKRFPNVLGNAFRRLKGFPNVLGNAFRSLKRFPNVLGNTFPLVGTPVGKNRHSSSAEASFPHSKSPFFSPLSTFESFSEPLGKPLDSAHKLA